jgi:acyl-CoA thioesterase
LTENIRGGEVGGEASQAGGSETTPEILRAVSNRGPFGRRLGMRCLSAGLGYCRMAMTVPDDAVNMFGGTHGGAVFSLIDEAFSIACNSHGVVAAALNLSVTYVSGSSPGDRLVAEAREISVTRRTATYDIRVTREDGDLVAVSQGLAYRKSQPLPPFGK